MASFGRFFCCGWVGIFFLKTAGCFFYAIVFFIFLTASKRIVHGLSNWFVVHLYIKVLLDRRRQMQVPNTSRIILVIHHRLS